MRYWPYALSAAVVLLDRATKHVIETNFAAWDTVRVIPGFFQIVSTRNTGMAFSLFDNSAAGRTSPLLVAFTVAVMGVVAWLLWQSIRTSGSGGPGERPLEFPSGAGPDSRRGRG